MSQSLLTQKIRLALKVLQSCDTFEEIGDTVLEGILIHSYSMIRRGIPADATRANLELGIQAKRQLESDALLFITECSHAYVGAAKDERDWKVALLQKQGIRHIIDLGGITSTVSEILKLRAWFKVLRSCQLAFFS